ncbi:MAG: AAA family ATPase, partial [Candidatus Omnitrophota bacterium]
AGLKAAIEKIITDNFGTDCYDANYEITKRDGRIYFGEVELCVSPEVRSKFIRALPLCETITVKILLKKLAKTVLFKENVLLVGLTGGGKTNLPRYLSDLLNCNYTALDLDGQTDTAQLIGQWIPDFAGGYEWHYGDLVNALDKDWWILLDEINLTDPEIIERINSILDDDAFLVISENEGKTFRRKEKFRLFTAMNPVHYSGRKRLSIAMANKFHQIWVPQDLGCEEEVDIINHYFETQQRLFKEKKQTKVSLKTESIIENLAEQKDLVLVSLAVIVLAGLIYGIFNI